MHAASLLCLPCVSAIFSGAELEYVAEGAIEVNLPVGTRNQLHRDLGNGVILVVR